MITLTDIIQEIYQGGIPRFLYHATYNRYLPSISRKGLVPCIKKYQNFPGCEKGVYLSNSKYEAQCMAEATERDDLDIEDIRILTIDTRKLDPRLFEKDPHVNYGKASGLKSFLYRGTIPYNAITEFENPIFESSSITENRSPEIKSLSKKIKYLHNLLLGDTPNKFTKEQRNKLHAKLMQFYDRYQKLKAEDPYEQERETFLKSQNTGFIPSHAYDRMTSDNGLDWAGPKSKYKKHLETKTFGKYQIEFKQEDRDLKYVQLDSEKNIVRDKNGDAMYMTLDQMKKENLPLKETNIVAFHEDKPVGLASNEFGTVGVWVTKKYQGLGIGTYLMDLHIQQRPDVQSKRNKIGQMTNAGVNMTLAYYDYMTKKHGKNWWYHTN